jgi:O-antigen/teichoic acid export membrane protein
MTRSLALRGIGGVVAALVTFAATRELLWSVLAMSVASAAVLVSHDLPVLMTLRSLSSERLAERALRDTQYPFFRLLVSSAPLGITSAIQVLNLNIPRYVLAARLTSAEVGVFVAMAVLPAVGGLLISALGQAIGPTLALAWQRYERRTMLLISGTLLACALAAGIAGIVIALVCGEELVKFLFGPHFTAQLSVLTPIMVAGGLTYIAISLAMLQTVMRLFKTQMGIALVTVAVNGGLGWTLSSHVGLSGAVWGWCLATAFQVVAGGAAVALYLVWGATVRLSPGEVQPRQAQKPAAVIDAAAPDVEHSR